MNRALRCPQKLSAWRGASISVPVSRLVFVVLADFFGYVSIASRRESLFPLPARESFRSYLLFRSYLVSLKGLFGKLPEKTGSPQRIRPVADWQPVLPIRDIRVIGGF